MLTGAFADFLIEFMNEANEDELTDEDVRHQLEETLGKETLEKQRVSHKQESHSGHVSPQISVADDGTKASLAQGKGSLI